MSESSCCCSGPGYASPADAIKGPKEKLLYMPCIVHGKADYIATVDCDPESSTFSQVISRVKVPSVDDELHHTGWNSCSSCFGDKSFQRRFLIAPALRSGNIYIFDTQDPRNPALYKTVSGEEIKEKYDLTWPHTSHCLGSGEIMISYMGDAKGNAKGNFLLLDGKDFSIKGTWTENNTPYGYDFWYQPRHNVMVSTEWGEPNSLRDCFNPQHVADGKYGHTIHFWDWKERKKIKSIELGTSGLIPLETRFLHDPSKPIGFVGAALSSSVILYYKDDAGEWQTKVVIQVEPLNVGGWALPQMPGLITDILISLDDRFLYFSNWLQGDIRQYDISDPHNPKLVGQLFVGGSIRADGAVTVEGREKPVIQQVKGTTLRGGPQMIQLSLDGKRLYCTNSLFSPWDKQFYPTMYEKGSQLLRVDVDNVKGGLTLNQELFVDFGNEPDGPALCHEVRYPGGDCSSDIWL